ncbi:MAG: hypothetical protein U5M23_03480 [Marinagarivorans sp.]|nr:hypothetical protein [Marinagarivorans sp.]
MQANDLRVFIPSKNFEQSQVFYQAMGFSVMVINDDLRFLSLGSCSFFLQNYYNQEFANNLMLQLIVPDINDAFKTVAAIKDPDFRFEPIKQEHWGKVVYMWGPAGELWHITELAEM